MLTSPEIRKDVADFDRMATKETSDLNLPPTTWQRELALDPDLFSPPNKSRPNGRNIPIRHQDANSLQDRRFTAVVRTDDQVNPAQVFHVEVMKRSKILNTYILDFHGKANVFLKVGRELRAVACKIVLALLLDATIPRNTVMDGEISCAPSPYNSITGLGSA